MQDDVPYGVVAPDDHIVMDSAELRRLSIFVDTRHSRIGCLNCCTSVRPRSILQHIQRHGFRNVDLDIGDYLAKNFHVQHDDQILPLSTPSLPVFGLDIIQDCVVCPECHRGFAKPDSLRAHHTKVHQGTVRKEAYRSACQTFFRGRARRYFPVDLTKLVPVDSTSDLGLYKLNRPIFTPANAVVQAPANQRSLSLFLASECWISYIEGINSSTVREIVTVPKDDHTIRPLRAHMDHWYRSAQVVLADTAANIVTRVSLGDLYVFTHVPPENCAYL